MRPLRAQRGVTLVVALIMLVVLTLLAISTITDSNSNLRVAGNMQQQTEATAAAQQALEQVLSNNFTAVPAATTISVDINNDLVTDYTVSVTTPTCVSTTPLTNDTPNLPPECLSSTSVANAGIVTASGGSTAAPQSWCYAQLWELQANVSSADSSGAAAVVHQGASLNVPVGTGC